MASPAVTVRAISLLHLVIICLTFSLILRKANAQPTTPAMPKSIRAICIRLLTKENAFFDPKTEMMFRCSTSTCPGVFGCRHCCPNINNQMQSETKVNPSEAKCKLPLLWPLLLCNTGLFCLFEC